MYADKCGQMLVTRYKEDKLKSMCSNLSYYWEVYDVSKQLKKYIDAISKSIGKDVFDGIAWFKIRRIAYQTKIKKIYDKIVIFDSFNWFVIFERLKNIPRSIVTKHDINECEKCAGKNIKYFNVCFITF